MRFADPYFLLLLAAVPVLLLIKSRYLREEGAGRFSTLGLLAGYRRTWRVRFRWLPTAMRAVAIGLMVVALARPQIGQAESELPGQGIDITLVMDTSSSMGTAFAQEDSRMVVAKRVISEFIEGRKDDRIGLVIFRENSLVLSPLTLDYDALVELVDTVDKVNLPDGTAIGIGLADGINLLRESKARSRVAVLLTDGENNAGTVEPLQASRIAETLGVRVYTIGLIEQRTRGTTSVNVDERALQEMAQLTGGRYFAAENEQALAQIYDSVDKLEKSRVGRPQYAAYNELAAYFLAGALGLLAFELTLRARVWRQAT